MSISVECPHCDARVRAADTAAGKRIRCPKCKELLKVPAPLEDEDEPKEEIRVKDTKPSAKARRPVADEDDEEEPRARPYKTKKNTAQMSNLPLILGVGGGAVVLVGVIVGLVIWLSADNKKSTPQASVNSKKSPDAVVTTMRKENPPGPSRPNPAVTDPPVADPVVPLVTRTIKERQTLQIHHNGFTFVAFSPDGSKLASRDIINTVKIWDLATGKELTTIYANHDVSVMAFNRDGNVLATGSQKEIKLWSLESGKVNPMQTVPGRILTEPTMIVLAIVFLPDGLTMASSSTDGTIQIWDLTKGSVKAKLIGPKQPIARLACSTDGETLVSSTNSNREITLWNVSSGQVRNKLESKSDGIGIMALSSDNTLAIANYKGEIWLLDVKTGKERIAKSKHERGVYALAFSADGKLLASTGLEKSVKLWDVQSGLMLGSWKPHTDAIPGIVFSPDGKTLISASTDQTVKLWDVVNSQK